MITNRTSNSPYYSANSSWSTYTKDNSTTSTFDPQIITAPIESPTNFLNEIHDFLDFSEFERNLGDDSNIIHQASSCNITEKTWEFEKGNNVGSCNLIATSAPLQQTRMYCSTKPGCFSPWVTPKNGGFMMTTTPTKPEGQLLLKNCLLKMLPKMRDIKTSKHYVHAQVNPDSKLVKYSKGNTASSPTSSEQQNDIARNHALAERTRRKKQSECLKVLQALLPRSPKKDKVSVIQSAIEQFKELKACKEDLEKHIEELESTNAILKSFCASGSLANRETLRGVGHMGIDTNIRDFTSINSSGDSSITSVHTHHHSEHDIHHGDTTSSGGRPRVFFNSTQQSGNTLTMSILILARLTLGSDQLIKVLTCLKDLGIKVLLVKSRFEGSIFMAQISARTNEDTRSSSEAKIQDAIVKALFVENVKAHIEAHIEAHK